MPALRAAAAPALACRRTRNRASAAKPAAYTPLQDIHAGRDDRRVVTLKSGKAAFRINRDDVDFTLTEEQRHQVVSESSDPDANQVERDQQPGPKHNRKMVEGGRSRMAASAGKPPQEDGCQQ